MPSSAPARIASALVGLAALAAAPSAPAALLDEPPKLYTFKLDDPSAHGGPSLPLLASFRDAAADASSGSGPRRYLSGTWGRWRRDPWWALSWQAAQAAQEAPDAPSPPVEPSLLDDEEPLFGFSARVPRALALVPETAPTWLMRLDAGLDRVDAPLLPSTGQSFASNGFDALWSLPPKKPIPNWRCRRRPVRLARYGGESDTFPLVRCDGSAAAEAYDRLTLIVREATAPRPGELLPDEPDAASVARGEWAPGVRLAHPRLLWVLQRIADAFPWRTLYVYSGYRHDPEGRAARPGTHHSMHSEARAVDVTVMGIPNVALFQLCRTLEDVGCGFYPNNRFVHVDVRAPGSGHPLWIDVSGPGEPSRYVDAWPGVVEGGALVWDPAGAAGQRAEATRPGAEASCTRHAGP
jgi:hypothetical protein